MKGKMYVFQPGRDQPEVQTIYGPMTTDILNTVIEPGYLQEVPGFGHFGEPGAVKNVPCIAFCHEEGKMRGMPYNEEATVRWCDSMGMDISQWDKLVGPVVVLVGDDEFMETI